MNKKGDLSLNVIIVAVISLVVLVVLVAIFTGKLFGFTQGVDTTKHPATTGICMYDSADKDGKAVYYRCENKVDKAVFSRPLNEQKDPWLDCGKADEGTSYKCVVCIEPTKTSSNCIKKG